MRAFSAAILLLLLAGWSTETAAKPKSTTNYKYYTVAGDSAVELYLAMMQRGPHVNGDKAYAATTAQQTMGGRFIRTNNCRLNDFSLSLEFTIKLPKLANESALPKETRDRWRAFTQFLRKHEETHRSIWLACAAELERRAMSVKARTCEGADAQIAKIADEIREACNKKHDAFDAAEQKRVAKHPFVKLVLTPPASSTAALSTGKTKKKRKTTTN